MERIEREEPLERQPVMHRVLQPGVAEISLTVSGTTSTVILNSALNSFTGGVFVKGGTLKLDTASSSGAGSVVITSGASQVANFTFNQAALNQIDNTSGGTVLLTQDTSATLDFANAGQASLGAQIASLVERSRANRTGLEAQYVPFSQPAIQKVKMQAAGPPAPSADPFANPPPQMPAGSDESQIIQNYLQAAGVDFTGVPGAELIYDGQGIIVTQTPLNIERIRNLLGHYDYVKQVTIESKFMEVIGGGTLVDGMGGVINWEAARRAAPVAPPAFPGAPASVPTFIPNGDGGTVVMENFTLSSDHLHSESRTLMNNATTITASSVLFVATARSLVRSTDGKMEAVADHAEISGDGKLTLSGHVIVTNHETGAVTTANRVVFAQDGKINSAENPAFTVPVLKTPAPAIPAPQSSSANPSSPRPDDVAKAKEIASLVAKGRAQFHKADFEAAEQTFQQVVGQDGLNTEAHYFLQEIQQKIGGAGLESAVIPLLAPVLTILQRLSSDAAESSGKPQTIEKTVMDFLQSAGVNFSGTPGASLTYGGAAIIVTQTPLNLERIRSILGRYNNVK